MNILIAFFAISIATTLSGTLIVLVYYYFRKKQRIIEKVANEDHIFKTEEGISKLSEKSDEILREIKGLSGSLNNDIKFDDQDVIDFDTFLDRVKIKNRKIDTLAPGVERVLFNVIFENKSIVKFGVLRDKNLNRIIVSSHTMYSKHDDKRILRSLLAMNGSLIPKYTIRTIANQNYAICVEYVVFSLNAPYQFFEYIYNLLIMSNFQLVQISQVNKWNTVLYKDNSNSV